MADRTRPIVRLDVMEGMVTKGYRKGVYDRVTKGTRRKYWCWTHERSPEQGDFPPRRGV